MPSPFPGMDPYLENPGDWPDFHARFIIHLSSAIGERVPDYYDVRIDERPRVLGATLKPVSVAHAPPEIEERPDRSIKIYKRPGRSLVTVVELLSTSNKAGPDRHDYP